LLQFGFSRAIAVAPHEDEIMEDLNTLSLRELRDLQAKVAKAIATYEERRKRETLAEVEELVRERGYTLAELMGLRPDRKRGKAKAPATGGFANPANPSEIWSGRGRRPRWFIEAVAAGRDPQTMRI
jgi:DNA-binding protein H-NS